MSSPSGSFADTARPTGWPDAVFSATFRVARAPSSKTGGPLVPVLPKVGGDQPLTPSSLCARTCTSYSVSGSSPSSDTDRPATSLGLSVLQPRPGSRWRRSYFIGGPVFAGARQLTDRLLPLPSTNGASGVPGGSRTSSTFTVTAIVAGAPWSSPALTVTCVGSHSTRS